MCFSGVTISDIDAVAVTAGPGLALCLKVGLNFAQSVCKTHMLPFIPVNHLEAHVLVSRLQVLAICIVRPFSSPLVLLYTGSY